MMKPMLSGIATLTVASFVLAGCATTPVSETGARPTNLPSSSTAYEAIRAPREGYGRVVVIRDSGFKGGGAQHRLFVDGAFITELRPSEKLEFYLSPGTHLLGVQIVSPFHKGQVREISAIITPGKTQYFRTGMKERTDTFIAPTSQAE